MLPPGPERFGDRSVKLRIENAGITPPKMRESPSSAACEKAENKSPSVLKVAPPFRPFLPVLSKALVCPHLGYKGLGYKGLGYKGLGYKGLGYKGLGAGRC
eukprot:363328-Chlamydomonas_euryale.AAC.6